jgi:DNA phosphorothioation-associated putative methyltransferase
VVNLGFVLNVIEDPRERTETLKSAWDFAKRSLCVAVMIQGKASIAGHKPYRDGFLTSRGTFQKYFDQQEFQTLVAGVTGQQPLAFAPGVIAAFKDKDLEQEVLLRRQSRAFVTGDLPRPPYRERILTARPELRERIAPAIDTLRIYANRLGRLPEQEETPAEALACISESRVPWQRALDVLRDELQTDETFAVAGSVRREDLLVHLALMQFPGAPKYRHLPRSIQTDIKAFFRGHSAALEESRRLLFAAGVRRGVRTDIEAAVADGLGGMRGTRYFRFRTTVLPKLSQRLRVLVGSAEALQGGVEASDFVEIDLETPRIVMITCDDIDRLIPSSSNGLRSISDGSRSRQTDVIPRRCLPIPSRASCRLASDRGRDKQLAFEATMAGTGLFESDAREPAWSKVKPRLANLIPDL